MGCRIEQLPFFRNMALNISTMSDAVMAELAAIVQDSAARAEWSDANGHSAPADPPLAKARLRDATASVLTGTRVLFPGEVSIEALDDPEISGLQYLMVSCRSNQTVEEIMAAFNQWHEKLTAWAPGLEHLFRLSIDAIE